MYYESYIKGVLDGDGYVDYSNSNPRLSLGTVNRLFAMRFLRALKEIGLTPRVTERDMHRHNFNGYSFSSHVFFVRATMHRNKIKNILNLDASTLQNKIAYLKGIYDSEGYYGYFPENHFHSLILRNSDVKLLKKIKSYLSEFGINSHIYIYKSQIPALQTHDKKSVNKFKLIIGLPRTVDGVN